MQTASRATGSTRLPTTTWRASLKVTQVPSSGKVIIGQIHNVDEGDDPPIKLQYEYSTSTNTGSLAAIYRLKPGISTSKAIVLRNVALGASFSYSIALSKGGTLAVYAKMPSTDTLQWTAKLDPAWAAQTMYFKAGSYVQDNTGNNTEGRRGDLHQAEHRTYALKPREPEPAAGSREKGTAFNRQLAYQSGSPTLNSLKTAFYSLFIALHFKSSG